MVTVTLTAHERECIFEALCLHAARSIRLDAIASQKNRTTLLRRRMGWPPMNPQTTPEMWS